MDYDNTGQVLSVEPEHLVFGLMPMHKNKAINKLLIWYKWIIYRHKFLGFKPNATLVKEELKKNILMEKCIRYKNLQHAQFDKEWIIYSKRMA